MAGRSKENERRKTVREYTESALQSGMGRTEFMRVAPEELAQLGVKTTPYLLNSVWKEVREEWKEAFEGRDPDLVKEAQIRRLYALLAQLKISKKPMISGILRTEAQIAALLGTNAPTKVKIEHEIKETMLAVVAELEGPDIDRLTEDFRRDHALVSLAKEKGLDRRLPPSLNRKPPQVVEMPDERKTG